MDILSCLVELANKSEILTNEPMTKHTTFRIGGVADYLVNAGSFDDIINVIKFANQNNIPLTVIGNGSNLLVGDKGIRGITLKIYNKLDEITVSNDVIFAQSGALLSKIGNFALQNELSGFEALTGIPGTLGGGIYMNAGAYGGEIRDVVLKTLYIDCSLNIKELSNEQHHFSYRKSVFSSGNDIIIGAFLKLFKADKKDILDKINHFKQLRVSKQPLELPSAGSTFKRPDGYFAAQLIEDAGLKGFSIGGASVSKKHSGFIVNVSGATASDVLKLIEVVKQKIFCLYGVVLEEEVKCIGEF